jgi:hypothetical protein
MGVPGAAGASRETVDVELRRLGTARSKNDFELCRWLRIGAEVAVHRSCGFASIREYSERVLGLSPRETEERLRMAAELDRLPELSARFEHGELHFAAVRELTRVATSETELEWLAATATKTTREVERMVSGTERGDRPSDVRRPEARRHKVTLDLAPATFALLRDARDELTRRTGHSIGDDAFASLLAQAVLAGVDESSHSSYRVTFSTCEGCGVSKRIGGAEDIVVEPSAIEAAMCDAEMVDPRTRHVAQDPAPAVRREVLLRHHGRCAVPGCRNSIFLAVHHAEPRADGGTHDANELVALCSVHHDAVHRGVLVVRGDAKRTFTFWHADGSPYGSRGVSLRLSQTLGNVLGALCSLGFKTREARKMIDAVRDELDEHVTDDAALHAVLCAAPAPGRACSLARASGDADRVSERQAPYGRPPSAPPRGGCARPAVRARHRDPRSGARRVARSR